MFSCKGKKYDSHHGRDPCGLGFDIGQRLSANRGSVNADALTRLAQVWCSWVNVPVVED